MKRILILLGLMAGLQVGAQTYRPVEGKMITRWGKEVTPENVWKQYPRPQLKRDNWQNLNGMWEYAIVGKDAKQPSSFDGEILVPFAVESALSGVGKTVLPEDRIWYRRTFHVPADWKGKNIILHFEAVDWESSVWINGKLIGSHKGGSKAFSFDVTRYLKKGKQDRITSNIFNQLNETDFIYVSSFDPSRQLGHNFTFERFKDNNELDFKISAANIRWVEKDSNYRLTSYRKRKIIGDTAVIDSKRRLDTIFAFEIGDLTPVSYVAETKNFFELDTFIQDQKRKGASNINPYILVKYKRWALPIAAFILTIIAVAVSSVKRRGGMGVNLAFGIGVAFIYIFFDKVFGTLAEQSGFSPLWAVIIPNVMFGAIAFYLLQNAKR